jgi:hypothetical protein
VHEHLRPRPNRGLGYLAVAVDQVRRQDAAVDEPGAFAVEVTARDYPQGLLSGIECKTAGTWPSMPGMPIRRRCSANCARTCDDSRSGTWRLNVIPDAQGRGVGRFAVESVAAEIRRRDGTQMYLTWEPGENGPEGFHWKLWFQLTGEKSEGQTIGVLDLTNA